ncbi:MAG: OmpA family protein [Alphaproteobacteria bacterium]
MKHINLKAFGVVAVLAISAFSGNVEAAQDSFTAHYSVDAMSYEDYTEHLSAQEKLELRQYLDYQRREPCQNYLPVPQGFVKHGCSLRRVSAQGAERKQRKVHVESMKVYNVLNDYEVHFAFDSARIGSEAAKVLDQVAQEIKRYEPREVTVAGHTDRAGPSSYNVALSQRRAQAVSDALNDRGVVNRVLDQKAYGEEKPAIDTEDGVALQENRRVVIEFHE